MRTWPARPRKNRQLLRMTTMMTTKVWFFKFFFLKVSFLLLYALVLLYQKISLIFQIYLQYDRKIYFWKKLKTPHPPNLYSDLPNNCAANLISFWQKKTKNYTTLLGPTRLLSTEIFLTKSDSYLQKWEKILPTRPYILRPSRLLIYEKSATYTIKWSHTIF